ncbi:SUMF1/EgtB/PvdO family nonheme iron enzyme [Algibacter miyuki]|uniref:SUMF1/EgtB/PvdO family nonheme iron enzyme n=1 Tax=Algibacter miyuki TaxID=1306933 RepID=A0ABV5GZR8_9FLAO|nr:SUMF1/EgtB/PvdO family nonheme iron enzyme [Algibacter miyuki]MDN3666817.1 SUMF1/EgtB/PvdO family nonheme iron enzyme [Algibacter miyuki]
MKTKTTLLILMLFCLNLSANNINVSNISLENQNAAQWVQVEFDLSWENSWRISAGPSNWDAAWVFIKYRINSGDWQHAQLSQSDFVAASGSTIDVSKDGVGAFIYRDSDGSGDLILQDLRLRWDYDSIDSNDIIDIKVFAIEMVYVPEGPFFLGGGTGDERAKFYSGNLNTSYNVTSENAISISNGNGNLYYDAGSILSGGDQLGPIPASYPKGYNAFYCMKYEATQGQVVAYFNTLTEVQKAEKDPTGPHGTNRQSTVYRNNITWTPGSANATTTTPDIAINYIDYVILVSYLDWAGLRPMSEFEYEKACRGPILPKANEYAWGNTNIATEEYTFSNIDTPSELITNIAQNTGNIIYNSTDGLPSGPKRVGILAASSINHTREETGGSYYGIMELSGNLYERVIYAGNPNGRAFVPNHGDGNLTNLGDADVDTWPIINPFGWAYRGGAFANTSTFMRVSDRYESAAAYSTTNSSRIGFRAVRSAN